MIFLEENINEITYDENWQNVSEPEYITAVASDNSEEYDEEPLQNNEVKEKQARDYRRLNTLETETNRQRLALTDSLTERKLLMKGILACLDGMEQQGCNHAVTSTKLEISTYLNEAAHSDDSSFSVIGEN